MYRDKNDVTAYDKLGAIAKYTQSDSQRSDP